MNKTILILSIVVIGLLVMGCTKSSYQSPTGYEAYGQQANGQPAQQGGYSGGCSVAAPEAGAAGNVVVSNTAA